MMDEGQRRGKCENTHMCMGRVQCNVEHSKSRQTFFEVYVSESLVEGYIVGFLD